MMKEKYFTQSTIEQKSKQILADTALKVKIKDVPFLPENSALIVLDMQDFFFEESSHACVPSAEVIILNIKRLVDRYIETNLTVIFTKHVNTDANANLMGIWWKDVLKKENPLSKITPLLNAKNALIIEKTQYDAFFGTELKQILEEKNIKQLVITGVMTHLCCDTTARSAFIQGFQPFLPVDATATYNEEFHRASVLNLSHGFATPVLTENILEKL